MAGMILAAALDVMDRPWKWGEADCCTAACDVFDRLYGIDPMASLRGRYTSRREAYRIVREMGGFEAMTQTLADKAGLREGNGEPGEIGIIFGQMDGFALGICLAPGSWAGKTPTGLATLPAALRSWRRA